MKNKNNDKPKKNNKVAKIGCLSTLGLILIIVIIGLIVSPTVNNYSSDKTTEAYVVSQSIAKSHLQFPESADFSLLPVLSEIQPETDSVYRVVGELTVKNAFGVKSKKRYICRMKYIGGKTINPNSWKIIDFNF